MCIRDSVRPAGHTVRPGFNQYLNQYHSAKAAVWDSTANTMHSIFFGGLSRYTLDTITNTLLDDPNVPFVRTISMITRFANDSTVEYKMPVEMPALTGSSAEFIPVITTDDEMIRLNSIPPVKTLIGSIVGGIESTLPNIFFINTGVESFASTRIFKVCLLYTSPSPRDRTRSRMPSSACNKTTSSYIFIHLVKIKEQVAI